MKKLLLIIILCVICSSCKDAHVASSNISKKADMFEVYRRVVFYNGITGDYMLSIEGFASIKYDGMDRQLEVTVKTGHNQYKKHFLGLSDNVTYFAEQLEASKVSAYHYKVIFKPESIIPDFDLKTKSNTDTK